MFFSILLIFLRLKMSPIELFILFNKEASKTLIAYKLKKSGFQKKSTLKNLIVYYYLLVAEVRIGVINCTKLILLSASVGTITKGLSVEINFKVASPPSNVFKASRK